MLDLYYNHRITLAELTAYTQDKVPDYVSFRRGKRQMPLLLGTGGRITLLDLSGGVAGPRHHLPSTGMKHEADPAGEFLMGSPDSDKDAQTTRSRSTGCGSRGRSTWGRPR